MATNVGLGYIKSLHTILIICDQYAAGGYVVMCLVLVDWQ